MRRIILVLISAICFVSCGSEGNVSELQEQNKQLEIEKAELIKENEKKYFYVNDYRIIVMLLF